jgi:uncharacterized protein YggE
MKKKWLVTIGLSLAVLTLVVAGCSTSPLTVGQQSTGIWVTGEGELTVTPDLAILNLGVESQAKTVAEAQQQAREAMDSVMAELDRYDIAEKDIQTSSFSIYPVYEWEDLLRKQELVGYQVTNTVTVKVRKLDDTGPIIDAVADAGGDYIRITSVSFTVDDPTTYYEEVREKAMTDAKAKAKQLADLGDIGLGKPLYISEGSISAPIIREDYAKAESGSAPAPTTSISPGEIEIQLTIQVVYSIR